MSNIRLEFIKNKYELVKNISEILSCDANNKKILPILKIDEGNDISEYVEKFNICLDELLNSLISRNMNHVMKQTGFDSNHYCFYDEEKINFFQIIKNRDIYSFHKKDIYGKFMSPEEPLIPTLSSYNFSEEAFFFKLLIENKERHFSITNKEKNIIAVRERIRTMYDYNFEYNIKTDTIKCYSKNNKYKEQLECIKENNNFKEFIFSGLKVKPAVSDILNLMFDYSLFESVADKPQNKNLNKIKNH